MAESPAQLAQALEHVGNELGDLTAPNREAADLIRDAAQPPRVTGRLAGSLTVDATLGGAVVGSDLVYAGVIHGGWAARNIRPQPFLTDALTATQDQVVALFHDHIADIIRSA